MASSERAPGRRNQLPPVVRTRTQPASRPAGVPAAALETRFFSTPDGRLYRVLPNNQVELYSYGAVTNPDPAVSAAQRTATQAAANAQAVTDEVVAARSLGGTPAPSLSQGIAAAIAAAVAAAPGGGSGASAGAVARPFTQANIGSNCILTVDHGLGTVCPIVQLYNNNGYQTAPASIQAIDANNVAVDLSNVADAHTSLLLPLSADFTDISGNAVPITLAGAPVIQAAPSVSPLGVATAAFFSAGNYLTFPATGNLFNISSDNWTVEAWFNLSSYASYYNDVIGQYGPVNWGWVVYLTPGALQFWCNLNNYNFGYNYSVGAWHHLAAVRSGNAFYLFVDGIMGGPYSMVGAISNFTSPLQIANGNAPYNGYLQEVRVSNGVARWTAPFTPPQAPYPAPLLPGTWHVSLVA